MCKGFLNRCLFIINFKRRFILGKKIQLSFRVPWYGLWHLWAGGSSSSTLCGIEHTKPLQNSNKKVWFLRLNTCRKCNQILLKETW